MSYRAPCPPVPARSPRPAWYARHADALAAGYVAQPFVVAATAVASGCSFPDAVAFASFALLVAPALALAACAIRGARRVVADMLRELGAPSDHDRQG